MTGGVRGSAHYRASVTERNVAAIKRRHADHDGGYKRLAKEYGTTPWVIKSIIKGWSWGHVAAAPKVMP